MNFGTWTAWTAFAHLPKIIFHRARNHMIFRKKAQPNRTRFRVGFQSCLCITAEICCIDSIGIQSKCSSEQFPSPRNGFFFEVITKGPIPKHLEKSMVIDVVSNIFKIVVLSTSANAFLRIDCARVWPSSSTKKDILELIHPRIRKEQRGIVVWHDGTSLHKCVRRFVAEEIDVCGSNVCSAHWEGSLRNCATNLFRP